MVKHRLRIRTRGGIISSPMFSAYTLMRLIREYPFLKGMIDSRALEHEMGILQARIFLLVLKLATPRKKLVKMKLEGEAYLTEFGYRRDLGDLTVFLGKSSSGRGRIRLEPVDTIELQALVRKGVVGNTQSSKEIFLYELGNLATLLIRTPTET